MPPEELEAHYKAVVASGVTTWESLAATARNNGWTEIEKIAVRNSAPAIETASVEPAETATVKRRTRTV